MRIRCAHNLDRTFFDLFGPLNIWVEWVGPSQGFAVLPFALVWQAKKAVADKKAAAEAEKVRSFHTGRVGRKCLGSVRSWPVCAATTLARPSAAARRCLGGWTGSARQIQRPLGLAAAHTDGVRCAASLQRGALPFRRRRALCLRSMYFEGSALPTQ